MHKQIASPRHGSSGIVAFQSRSTNLWRLVRVPIPGMLSFAPINIRINQATQSM
jgi:hypothetical protein